jgi:DNA-binding GntR family transcriptional regulator
MSSLDALEFHPAMKQTLTESVAASLRSAILVRHLKPGQRIPEAQIATKMGVSRAPVRDALAVLLQEGLVHRDDRGMSVILLTKTDVDEISSLRLALETSAVSQAVRNATDEDFARLKANIERTTRAKAEDEAGELDLEFHELLVRSAKNKRLLTVWLSLQSQIRLILRQMVEEDAEYPKHTADAHHEFLELLIARDESKAVSLLERHLECTHQKVAEHFERHHPERNGG